MNLYLPWAYLLTDLRDISHRIEPAQLRREVVSLVNFGARNAVVYVKNDLNSYIFLRGIWIKVLNEGRPQQFIEVQ